MVHIDDVEKLQKLDRNLFTVTVFGYNSARFDSNLFKEYLNYEYQDMKWSVDNTSLIGSQSSMKQFVIKSDMYGLRFIDAQSLMVSSDDGTYLMDLLRMLCTIERE